MHIAIAGNIGSGKTTLTQLLARHYKWDQLQEAVRELRELANGLRPATLSDGGLAAALMLKKRRR